MTSRAAHTKNRRGGQGSATQPCPLPSPGRSSVRGNTNGAQPPSAPTATFPRRQPPQGEERDHTQQCPSDFSMEDGNGGGPSNPYPSAPPDAGPKSDKNFPAKLKEVLQKLPQYIEQLDDNTLLIRDVTNFFTHAWPDPFGGIQSESFEHELRRFEKYSKTATGANWSLWVRKGKAPRPNDPATQHTVQEHPPPASVPVPAIMAHRPPARPDLEARVDELQYELNTTNSELSATKSTLKETQDFAWNTQSEVNTLKDMLFQWIGFDTAKSVSAGSGPSQSVPDSGPILAHRPSQMHQAGGHGGTHDGLPLKPKTGFNGVEAPQGVPAVPETAPPYISVDHTLAAGQPAYSHSYGGGLYANPGTAQSYLDGHTTPGGTAPQVFLMEDGPAPLPQGASTSFGYQQSAAFAAGAPDSSQYHFSLSSPPPPNRTPPGNYSGAFGGPRLPTGFAYVQRRADPNTSNQGPQAYNPRLR